MPLLTLTSPGDPKNPFWLLVRNLLRTPSKDQVECQKPKPILLAVGEMTEPYAWSPNIVDVQLQRIGQLSLIIAPGEASTMAGRRWRESLQARLDSLGIVKKEDSWVVLGGPANTYTHYITTPEEYSAQRYEGASTLYGPYTLYAYISLTNSLANYLADTPPTSVLNPGPAPPIHTASSINLNTGVVQDSPPIGKKFGQVLTAPATTYTAPATITAKFVGANPRNNLRQEQTFLAVEQETAAGWVRVRDDDDYELEYEWKRTEILTGQSEVTARWNVPAGVKGRFRIRYFGDKKSLIGGKIEGFEGVTGGFEVK